MPTAPNPARAAAQLLDLSAARRLVYVGGDDALLEALLEAWPQLEGLWVKPPGSPAPTACRQGHRVHCVTSDRLDALPAADLVVVSAVDGAVESSLRLLVSARPGWLPVKGRWLILQRRSPHLSSVVDAALLNAQGLRVIGQWALAAETRLLVCARAHLTLAALDNRAARSTSQGLQA